MNKDKIFEELWDVFGTVVIDHRKALLLLDEINKNYEPNSFYSQSELNGLYKSHRAKIITVDEFPSGPQISGREKRRHRELLEVIKTLLIEDPESIPYIEKQKDQARKQEPTKTQVKSTFESARYYHELALRYDRLYGWHNEKTKGKQSRRSAARLVQEKYFGHLTKVNRRKYIGKLNSYINSYTDRLNDPNKLTPYQRELQEFKSQQGRL